MKHLPNVLLSLVLVALLPLAAGAQDGHDHAQMMADSEAAETTSDAAAGHAWCQDMMQMHQKMQEQMKAKDAELARLVEEMKSATGDAKVDAIAAALEELIDQHRSMQGMKMGHGSMPAMMRMHQHMQSMGGEMDMSNCPMMQEMKMKSDGGTPDDRSDDDEDGEGHEDHHS